MLRHVFMGLGRNRSNCTYTTSSLSTIPSLSVAYLTNSCLLPPEKAASISKLIAIQGRGKADSVFELLRSYGFSHTQLGELISRHPSYLLADAETNLRPKMQYLVSLGILRADLPQILFSNKAILSRSLKNQIAPTFDFLKESLTSYEDLVRALRQSGRILGSNVRKYMVPNTITLRDHRVPEQLIGKLMAVKPVTLMLKSDLFQEAVKQVEDLGFRPSRVTFILGVNALALQSKKNWENKREVLMRFGWSEDEFLSAFRTQPMMMLCSEAKLRELMEFFVDTLGLEPSQIAKCPNLFLVSLKKRVIPRCSVLQVLLSNGLIKKCDVTLVTALNMSSMNFFRKYLAPFQESVPDVVEAYKGKVEFRGFTDSLS